YPRCHLSYCLAGAPAETDLPHSTSVSTLRQRLWTEIRRSMVSTKGDQLSTERTSRYLASDRIVAYGTCSDTAQSAPSSDLSRWARFSPRCLSIPVRHVRLRVLPGAPPWRVG